MNIYIITQWRKNMNKMNNKKEKTMFSVETLDDDSGLSVKSHGHPVAVGFMIAIALVRYFDQEDTVLSMDDFFTILKTACKDSKFVELVFQSVSLYADNKSDGLKAFAMLMAAASVDETLTCGKKGGAS